MARWQDGWILLLGREEVERMGHSMFLTQIIGCVVAALVVLLVWEHHRLKALERKFGRMERPWNDMQRRKR